jgi:hypothetical protein
MTPTGQGIRQQYRAAKLPIRRNRKQGSAMSKGYAQLEMLIKVETQRGTHPWHDEKSAAAKSGR